MSVEELENTIYVFEEKLLGCADEVYFEYHKQHCTIDVLKDRFHKKYVLDYKIVNKHKYDNAIKLSLMLSSDEKITMENINKLVSFTEFKIDDKDFLNEVPNCLSLIEMNNDNSKRFDYKVSFKFDLANRKNVRVRMAVGYDVPLDDLSQVYKICKPSKKLMHEVFINNKSTKTKYKLNANAFTAFFVSGDSENSYFNVEKPVPTHVKVSFDDWVVPGAGYVVNIIKDC